MSRTSSKSDTELIALSTTIVERVRGLARRMCGRDAEDACQEVHREVARALPGFRGESTPTTWAHRIALRTLLRFAQRRRRRSEREVSVDELDPNLDAAAIADFRDEPFTRLVAHERREAVRDAIGALSAPLRDVLMLRVMEEMGYAEIADLLDLPLGTVKSRIAAATLRLTERLQRRGDLR